MFNIFKRIKIVRFNDGKYAVRKGWLFYEYLDKNSCGQWWSFKRRNWYKIDSEIQAYAVLEKYYLLKNRENDKGTPIKL